MNYQQLLEQLKKDLPLSPFPNELSAWLELLAYALLFLTAYFFIVDAVRVHYTIWKQKKLADLEIVIAAKRGNLPTEPTKDAEAKMTEGT